MAAFPFSLRFTGQIARLGNRVLMAAKNEADNSEDPSFVRRVNDAAGSLHSCEHSLPF
jgi:hypothetical protein